jgi:hypothetical protein
MINYLEIIKTMAIPQLHKDIIVGCGLGDAFFSLYGNGNASMGFGQGGPNKEYLYYLFSIMGVYATKPAVSVRTTIDRRYNKENISYSFSVKSSSIFHPFAQLQLFLDKTEKIGRYVKIVPYCIEDLLTPGALAFFLMDDGMYVKRGGITICTDNFSYDEVLLLKSVLSGKYNLQTTIHNKNPEKGYYRIYISGKSLPALRELVSEHMHPSMLYKIGK